MRRNQGLLSGGASGRVARTFVVSILIVDDHPSLRSFARDLLASEGFDVVGEAEDGQSGVGAALSLRPDVVLMDVRLPDISGFEATRRIRARLGTSVVLVSTRDESDFGDDVPSVPVTTSKKQRTRLGQFRLGDEADRSR